MPQITIKNWRGKVIREIEAADLKTALEILAADHADLRGADLRGAILRGADLRGADLRGAILRGADLRGADLRGADLTGAILTGAVLTGADLRGAILRGAILRGADLRGAILTDAILTDAVLRDADLRGADLRGAILRGAILTDADLTAIRDDLWSVLSATPAEAAGLLAALREGRVNGSTYEGSCACLVGTIANVRGCDYHDLAPALSANSSRPAEMFFLGIKTGDIPDTNPVSKLAAEWTEEWIGRMQAAFGVRHGA